MTYRILIVKLFLGAIFFYSCATQKKKQPVAQQPAPPKPIEKPIEAPKPEPAKTLNIAMLLPFDFKTNLSTDSAMLEEINPGTAPYLQFYEGAKIALDSLKKNGFNVTVKVFDSAIDSVSFINLMYKKEVMASDYIICSVNSSWHSTASVIAQRHFNKIIFPQPAASPLVINNKDAWQLMPSTNSQIERMCDFIQKNYSDNVISIVYRESKRETELKGIFKRALDSLAKANIKMLNVRTLLYNKALFDSGSVTLDSTKRNLVLITSSDEAFVNPVLNQLNSLNYFYINIAGLPTWDNFESIDFSGLKNLRVVYFMSNFIDLTREAALGFQKKFLASFGTIPQYNAYQGYNIMSYLARNTFQKETRLPEIFPFEFVKFNSNSGFENRHINVVGIENYKVVLKQ